MSLRYTGKFSNNRCHIIKFMKCYVTAFALPKNDTLAILSCGLLFISYQLPLATFYVQSWANMVQSSAPVSSPDLCSAPRPQTFLQQSLKSRPSFRPVSSLGPCPASYPPPPPPSPRPQILLQVIRKE